MARLRRCADPGSDRVAAPRHNLGGKGGPQWVGNLLWILCVLTPVTGIPAACVVAVLRYRLYDIDRLVSRTLAYAVVTGTLLAVYVGLVLLWLPECYHSIRRWRSRDRR